MKRDLSIAAWKVLSTGEAPDVAFVPPLVRRRFSPLQKIFFSLARAVNCADADEIVFASRDGEDALTRRIVDDYHADGSVSPQRFSTSVYNAAPGLWSVQEKNRAPYTAIAAGEDTIECGLLELLGTPRTRTFVYAEETGGGYGAAIRVAESGDGRRVALSSSDVAGEAISFAAWTDFLCGRTRLLKGRWLTVRALD